MANRMLRDWTQSLKIDELSCEAERFFTRLIMKVDDYGCFYADTRLLKANLYPLKLDSIREADLTRWMTECQKAGMIVIYESDGKNYLQICDFGQRLDKSRSKFPMPNGKEVINNSYVYLMHDTKNGIYKIGFSANPWARLKEVKRSVGDFVVLIGFTGGTTDDEKELHTILRKYNVKNEWFKLTNNISSSFIESLANKLQIKDLIKNIRSCIVASRTPSEREVEVETEVESGLHKKKFVPPTLTEVVEEMKNQFEAEKFFNYYESNGWRVGKNPMKNWPAAARNWLKNSKNYATSNTSFTGNGQRTTKSAGAHALANLLKDELTSFEHPGGHGNSAEVQE